MLDMLLALEVYSFVPLNQANPLPATMWYILHVLISPSHDKILSTIREHASDPSDPRANVFNLDALLTDPLLHALFSETLRLQATTLTVRGVTQDTSLPVIDDEYFIRKGTILIAPASALHMDEEIFPEPRKFKSDRFYGAGDIESVHIPGTGEGDYASAIQSEKTEKLDVKDKRILDIPGALIGRKDTRFKKNGVVVKHNLIPFGGGDHLVLSMRSSSSSAPDDDLRSMKSSLVLR
jgi:cytochrome P450